MVWRQLPKLVPAGSIPVSCSKRQATSHEVACRFFCIVSVYANRPLQCIAKVGLNKDRTIVCKRLRTDKQSKARSPVNGSVIVEVFPPRHLQDIQKGSRFLTAF